MNLNDIVLDMECNCTINENILQQKKEEKMDNLQRLIHKASEKGCRLLIRFDPQEKDEEWGIKFYPEHDDDAHFYAYNNDLGNAARQLLDELQGFNKW
jgi:RNA binding exosome subunit